MSDTAADDPTVTALLAMAEFFLSQRPLSVSEAVRCLLGVLALQPVPRLEASVRLRLGLLLSEHTSCTSEARQQLEKAMLVAGTTANLQGVRFHAASSLSALLSSQGHHHQARGLLRGKLEATIHHPYWHIRLLLQLADLLSREGDVTGQLTTLSRCADYSHSIGASHAHLLAVLARGAVLLTHHNYSEAGSVLNQASMLLDAYNGPRLPLLRSFYLTIQVTHLLMAGQVKTAKPHLKQLQHCVQSLSSQPEERSDLTSDLSGTGGLSAENFHWLTRHHAYITVYLVSVLHSVQAGFTDKALSYVGRAMQLMDQDQNSSSLQPSGVLAVLRTHVLEQSVQCLLMRGEASAAARQLQDAVDTCHAHHTLVYSHRAVLHTLLGLYAFATSNLDRAIAQFQTALQHTNCKELRVLVSLNLAISYMKVGVAKEMELAALMTSVNSDGATITCQSLQSARSYVQGLFSFTCGRLHDAKRQLRETLTVANSSDLNKLTSCSLLLLGQIFLALGNTKETLDMVSPALQLSVKMPDSRLQVWAASLLADLYHTVGEGEKEKLLRQQSSSVLQQLERDEKKAVDSKPHRLLQWTNGEWPSTASPEPATVRPPPEVKGHERVSGFTKPDPLTPRRSSITLNGSPISMKTPEILLKRVESPSRTTPPKSLLAMPARVPASPTHQAPHTHPIPRHLSSETVTCESLDTTSPLWHRRAGVRGLAKEADRGEGGARRGGEKEEMGRVKWVEEKRHSDHSHGVLGEDMESNNPHHTATSHPPNSHQDTHLLPSHQDTHLLSSHQDTHHPLLSHQDTHHPPLSHQDTHHPPLSHQDTHHPPLSHQDTHLLPSHQDTRHTPPSHQDARHTPLSHQDARHTPPSHQDARHTPPSHQDARHTPPSHQDARHTLPSHQDARHTLPSHQDARHTLPSHQDARHILPSHQDSHQLPSQSPDNHKTILTHSLYRHSSLDHTSPLHTQPHALTHNQVLSHEVPSPRHPQTPSSPSRHSLSHPMKTHSSLVHFRTQSSPSHSPHATHSHHPPQSHRGTPPQAHLVGQDIKLTPPSLTHHPSPLHQTPAPSLPSYEHSVHTLALRPHTPPSLSGSASHLSPTHPSRIPPHTSPAHIDAAVEQHMLQTQQRLLWQQNLIQAQQNHYKVAQSGQYIQPVAPHPSVGHSTGLPSHYVVQSGMPVAPPQLSHMATLQQISREPSRSHLPGLAHVMPSHVPVSAVHPVGPLHLLSGQLPGNTHLHRHGHQRR